MVAWGKDLSKIAYFQDFLICETPVEDLFLSTVTFLHQTPTSQPWSRLTILGSSCIIRLMLCSILIFATQNSCSLSCMCIIFSFKQLMNWFIYWEQGHASPYMIWWGYSRFGNVSFEELSNVDPRKDFLHWINNELKCKWLTGCFYRISGWCVTYASLL